MKMEPTERDQADIASQPAVAEEPQQTRSLEPDYPTADAELSFETQLTRGLDDCNWDELQEKYAFAMDEHSRVEEELRAETARLLEIFTSWSQTTVLQDENRALKRFKTQMQHVQNFENTMENKKKHYMEVVKAFQSALALLNEQLAI